MTARLLAALLVTLVASVSIGGALAQPVTVDDKTREAVVGDALLNEGAYRTLQAISDKFGPRMAGTQSNELAMDWLESRLRDLGIETHRESFEFAGWRRGIDRATVVAPFERELRAVAMGYVDAVEPFEADLVLLEAASLEEQDIRNLNGKIALLPPDIRFSPQQERDLADVVGLAGVLSTNRRNGGQLLARTANHTGEEAPLPQFNITQEEGMWLERLLKAGEDVRVRFEISSTIEPDVSAQNLVARIPGRSGKKVVLGAHFDSWDLGQGAMDNGIGVAQLYEIARLVTAHYPDNLHTIELVWFNGEEFGLWGSRAYVEQHDLDSIQVMVNFDMAGRPIQLNAMGFDELIPVLQRAESRLGNWTFEQPVTSKTWLGSDHHPFILKGVPSVTFNAPIDEESVKFYHDFGDTFDKIDRQMLTEGSAVYTLVALDLANDPTPLPHYSEDQTAELFRKAGLEERMRSSEAWPF